MRKLIITMLLSLTSVFAYDIQIENYYRTNMDYIFVIEDHNYERITLDCQGFINNVKIEQLNGTVDFFQLGYGECGEIHNQIMKNIANKLPVCLQLYMDSSSWRVKNDFCKI